MQKSSTEYINNQPKSRIITIFGSSRPLPGSSEYQTAYQLGKLIAEAGYIVCNGGYGGTMEASARGAIENGGKTIGVVTETFSPIANQYISQTIATKTLIERLMKLIELGDAYIVLKGATGTLLELAAVWELMNKQILKEKPIILLGSFWLPIVDIIKNELISEGFIISTKFITAVSSVDECIKLLIQYFEER